MADPGHSSDQGQSRPPIPHFDFQSNHKGSEMTTEKRKQLKLSFGQGSGGSFPQPGGGFMPFTGNSNDVSNSGSRQRIPHGRTRPPPDVVPDTNTQGRGFSNDRMPLHRSPSPAAVNTSGHFRIRMCQSMHSTGKLQLTGEMCYDFTAEDLQDLGEIGRGAFGAVNKMVHRESSYTMAVKRIRSTVDEKEQKQLLMDLDVVMRSNDCPYIVKFYGALFKEGDCWICMELMGTSLDKFYKYMYGIRRSRIPEIIIAKITVATVKALNYLKEKLKIIHRDVKPSNILLDRWGSIKLCDFGISGKLVDSIARTKDAGCRPYMAPERIDPMRPPGYDVRSDVWSLGITLMEVATGRFPYPRWGSVFEQLSQVVQGDPPRLTQNSVYQFSAEFVDFVNTCLIKEESQRPKYSKLLEHPFIRNGERTVYDVADYFACYLDLMSSYYKQY